MPNTLYDNTYFVLDTSATALPWPSGGARIKSLVIWAVNTNASVIFNIGVAGTPVFRFNMILAGANSTTTFPSTYTYDFGGVRFHTAWIPSTLTACSAWIHFV